MGAPCSFTVVEDVATGEHPVGTLSVSHRENATTTLAIISGNDGGHFALSEAGGITTARRLNFEAIPSYSPTVQAVAGEWGQRQRDRDRDGHRRVARATARAHELDGDRGPGRDRPGVG